MQEKGKGMYYIDLNDKQKSFIYSKCSVKHIKDVGPRSIMYKRLNSNAFFINTFVTNFNEKFLYEPYVENSESYYSWEYDIIYVPFKYADMVNKLLNITNEDIIRKRFLIKYLQMINKLYIIGL